MFRPTLETLLVALGGLVGRVFTVFIVDVLERFELEQLLGVLLGDFARLAGCPGAPTGEPAREPICFQLHQRHGDLLNILERYL
jgi:hypothetical protein